MLISNAKKLDKALKGEKPKNLEPEDKDLLDLGKKLSHTKLVNSDDIHVDAFFSETLKEKLYYDWARDKQNIPKKPKLPILKYVSGFAFAVASLVLAVYLGILYVNAPDSPARISGVNVSPTIENLVQPINAQLSYVNGRVEVWENDEWITAPDGLIVSADRQIRTASESKAILEFGDGSALRLSEDTHVIIEESDTENIIVQQIIGKSYSRVNKSSALTYTVRSLNTETTALGTAFTVEIDNFEKVKVKVLESQVKISLIQGDTITEEEVSAGQEAVVEVNKPAEESTTVQEIEQVVLQSEFFTWNREEDKKKNQPLGELEDIMAPYLLITNPANGTVTADGTLRLVGKTEKSASIIINNQESVNSDGVFEKEINLNFGDNIVEVISTDEVGNTTFAAILVKREERKKLAVETTKESEKEIYVPITISEPVKTPEITPPAKDVAIEPEPIKIEIKPVEPVIIKSGLISLSAATNERGAYLSWELNDFEAPFGFMIIVDDEQNPKYPGDYHYHFPYSYGRHYFQPLKDSGTYHIRICQFKKDHTCGIYSNTVQVTK